MLHRSPLRSNSRSTALPSPSPRSTSPNFVTDLRDDLALIDNKGAEQTDDKIEDVGDTDRISALIKEARYLIGSINTSIRNLFRRDPEILAEWRAAARIHRTGGSGVGETPTPVVVPA